MVDSARRGAWPQLRRGLILFAVLGGGVAVLSLFSGRPGDFEAGLPGAVVGGIAAAVVVAVEVVARCLGRKSPGAGGDGGDPVAEVGRPRE